MANHFNGYLLEQQPEGIHGNTLISASQNPILEEMKQIVCICTDQEVHLVFPEILMRYPCSIKVILQFFL